jgi:hypothetical protein
LGGREAERAEPVGDLGGFGTLAVERHPEVGLHEAAEIPGREKAFRTPLTGSATDGGRPTRCEDVPEVTSPPVAHRVAPTAGWSAASAILGSLRKISAMLGWAESERTSSISSPDRMVPSRAIPT